MLLEKREVVQMQEVVVKGNTTGLKVLINGVPDLKIIPKEESENTVIALEMQIAEYYKKKCENAKTSE